MTVKDLKALLEKIPDDYDVETEGCDCIDSAHGIATDDSDKVVCIIRNGYCLHLDYRIN